MTKWHWTKPCYSRTCCILFQCLAEIKTWEPASLGKCNKISTQVQTSPQYSQCKGYHMYLNFSVLLKIHWRPPDLHKFVGIQCQLFGGLWLWVPFSLPLSVARTHAGQAGGGAYTDLKWSLLGIIILRRNQDHCVRPSAVLAPWGCVMPWRSSDPPTSSAPNCTEVTLSSSLSRMVTLRGFQTLTVKLSPSAQNSPYPLFQGPSGYSAQLWPKLPLPFSPRS